MARLTKKELYDSVPSDFTYTLPSGKVIEKREDGVYLDGKLMENGPFFDCETATDYRRRAAEITNKHRRAATEGRIQSAQAQLIATGKKVTVTDIAKLARMSRQAIYKHHREWILEVSTSVRVLPISDNSGLN